MGTEGEENTLSGMKWKQVRMIDMHAHLSCPEELEFRKKQGVFTCFSAGTPEEWNLFWQTGAEQKGTEQKGTEQKSIGQTGEERDYLVSFGIHPWYANRYDVSEVGGCLRNCDFIGEIGMDSVWCEVPLALQQDRFERQLQIAADLKKPVILHTKGQERRIAEIIRDFPGRVCVHWYSGDRKNLEKFMEQDCYFTLGPDTARLCVGTDHRLTAQEWNTSAAENEAAQVRRQMVREIPVERLFVETDGIGAVAWARGVERLELTEIFPVLRENMEYTAAQKKLAPEVLEARMKKNLLEFLGV